MCMARLEARLVVATVIFVHGRPRAVPGLRFGYAAVSWPLRYGRTCAPACQRVSICLRAAWQPVAQKRNAGRTRRSACSSDDAQAWP